MNKQGKSATFYPHSPQQPQMPEVNKQIRSAAFLPSTAQQCQPPGVSQQMQSFGLVTQVSQTVVQPVQLPLATIQPVSLCSSTGKALIHPIDP